MATFKDIFERHNYNLADASTKSKRWFEQQARLLSSSQINGDRFMRLTPQLNVSSVAPGAMHLFKYDPKTKTKLPMWDEYPLVIPFNYVNGGFIGLNFHYLPYHRRIFLLDRLAEFFAVQSGDDIRLKFSWDLVSNMSKFRDVKLCVKRYITVHIVSVVKRIDSPNWATAMMLPVEQFVYRQ